MKANHNFAYSMVTMLTVVLNISKSKNESKSQAEIRNKEIRNKIVPGNPILKSGSKSLGELEIKKSRNKIVPSSPKLKAGSKSQAEIRNKKK